MKSDVYPNPMEDNELDLTIKYANGTTLLALECKVLTFHKKTKQKEGHQRDGMIKSELIQVRNTKDRMKWAEFGRRVAKGH